jgi:hypothetical protein
MEGFPPMPKAYESPRLVHWRIAYKRMAEWYTHHQTLLDEAQALELFSAVKHLGKGKDTSIGSSYFGRLWRRCMGPMYTLVAKNAWPGDRIQVCPFYGELQEKFGHGFLFNEDFWQYQKPVTYLELKAVLKSLQKRQPASLDSDRRTRRAAPARQEAPVYQSPLSWSPSPDGFYEDNRATPKQADPQQTQPKPHDAAPPLSIAERLHSLQSDESSWDDEAGDEDEPHPLALHNKLTALQHRMQILEEENMQLQSKLRDAHQSYRAIERAVDYALLHSADTAMIVDAQDGAIRRLRYRQDHPLATKADASANIASVAPRTLKRSLTDFRDDDVSQGW